MEKKKRDEAKMLLRNKLAQKQDLEEKHNFEVKIYKQKVKHLLQEQQSQMTDVRFDSEIMLRLVEDNHRQIEHEQMINTRAIKVSKKQMELAHLDLVRAIKVEQEKKFMALRMDFERKAEDLKASFEQKMSVVMSECDEKRKYDVNRLENKKITHIQKLMAKHKKDFDDIKNYYRDITHANLERIKQLKEEVQKLKDEDAGLQKQVNNITRINKKLSKPLEENKKKVDELKSIHANYQQEVVELKEVKEKLKDLEEVSKNVSWEYEIMNQKAEKLKIERDELRRRLETSIYDVQQKAGFRNIVLDKKIQAMTQDLEKTEAALSEVLASTNLQPGVVVDIRHSLEDVLMAKNKTVQRLEDNLIELKQRYAATIQLYEAKLKEFAIPTEDIGFQPVRRI
jgi:myosin heavy subunit